MSSSFWSTGTKFAVVAAALVALSACSSPAPTENATTSTQPPGPDTNVSTITIDDWAAKNEFCAAAAQLEGVPQGDTVDRAASYARTYAQVIRELKAFGPDDPAFVTTMNTVVWAAEATESVFSNGAPEGVLDENEFEYFAEEVSLVQGGPGVRTATSRLNGFLVDVCGFALGYGPQGSSGPPEGPTEPSADLKPPTSV
jgi:hypothetical protein